MRFSPVPTVAKKRINRAGHILADGNANPDDLEWAISLADQWRASHAYPINTFQATLRRKLRNYPGESIVAQRLKRMPTIVDKLHRYPNMQLTTMQDIGGVRAILDSVDDVYKLAAEYKSKSRFAHELINETDYIQNPRDEDGYRSLHLIYKYKNLKTPDYDGLRLELQIRTRLQHTWATAVETMGTLLGQMLKSRQGDQEWLDFFAITSSAFAFKEKTYPVPKYKALSKKETYSKVAVAEKKIRALENMRGLSVAVDEIARRSKSGISWSYHLITLNSLERTLQIRPYDRESLPQAMVDYSQVEKRAAKGEKIEPVLVSAGPIEQLRRAYPNFFLDINDFTQIVNEIVSSSKK